MSGIVTNEDAIIVVAGALVDHVTIVTGGNGVATTDGLSVTVRWGDLCCC